MEMSWAQCFGNTLIGFVFTLYALIAVVLLMLVVAAGFEKSWKTGLMVSLILLFWGSVGGCGLHWMLAERRAEWRRRRRGSDGGVEEGGRVKEGGRDSGLGAGGAEKAGREARERIEGGVRYESLYPQVAGDGAGSIQEAPEDGEREPLLKPSPTAAVMAVAARAGAFSGW